MDTIHRILVDHAGEKGIGDIVCESALYEVLQARHPGARLFSRQGRTLFWGHPLIAGFDETSPDEAFALVVRPVPCAVASTQLGQSLALGRSIFDHFLAVEGFAPLPDRPALYPLGRELSELGLENSGEGGLVVAYSADSKEPDRRWGEERFAELARYLDGDLGASVIEIGAGLCSGHLGIGLDMVGQTDLRQILALLSLADVFVGNHGGLTHLAGAVGTPVLVPWGASTPYDAYAYDAESLAVQTVPACRHCAWTGHVLPECQQADLQSGRVACIQAISVSDMKRAAKDLFERVDAHRALLQEQKRRRLALARDPRDLAVFEHTATMSPSSHVHVFFGGTPGWGGEHKQDNFARLKSIVAFPDWNGQPKRAFDLIARYVSDDATDAARVLFLTAQPWTGPQIRRELGVFLARELEVRGHIPKIAIILGSASAAERQALVTRAATYLPLDSPYDL